MSHPKGETVPKAVGKFVTFSKDCDNSERDLKNAIVYQKTQAPRKLNCFRSRFPNPDEIIDIPFPQGDRLYDGINITLEDCEPSSSRRIIEDCIDDARPTWEHFKSLHASNKGLRGVNKDRIRRMNLNLSKRLNILKRAQCRQQIDDLSLCTKVMSISQKGSEKMDEDSND